MTAEWVRVPTLTGVELSAPRRLDLDRARESLWSITTVWACGVRSVDYERHMFPQEAIAAVDARSGVE